jgi:CRISPR-associated endonuclease/helicase Cas3
MTLSADRFSEFFQAIHDDDSGNTFQPFPWQERLANRVIARASHSSGANPENTTSAHDAAWPECLALPTGSGKTTCLDIAVFALACQAELPASQRTAARKIIFVVDRRVIVDEAFEHARAMSRKLADAVNQQCGGILQEVAEALLKIAGAEALGPLLAEPLLPLTCHQLRGGMYRDDAWARTPTQPCVIASTVDQIGSRLLFRAYGRSSKAWGLQAGLAGNDSLIILDEAHCANPFLQTMRSITRYRRWSDQAVGGPFQFVVMSATPPADVKPFQTKEDDLKHEVLGARIRRRKLARLQEAKKAKGTDALQALQELAVTLIEQAAEFATTGQQRVGILVNRVLTARTIYQVLNALAQAPEGDSGVEPRHLKDIRKALKPLTDNFDVVLLTGRMRPIDRNRLMREWKPEKNEADDVGLLRWLGTSSTRPPLTRPVFVIATQCLEVGANLDFDALVTECASLDALRQRFGRLDRVARPQNSDRENEVRASVVVRADQTSITNPDPVYGTCIADTWKFLNDHTTAEPSDGTTSDADKSTFDFGISAVDALLRDIGSDELQPLNKAVPDAPIMLPAHLDCWVQTSPEPQPSPDPAIFLHGPESSIPDVQVCWRADLPLTPWSGNDCEETLISTVAIAPPSAMECMPVPLSAFRRWWADTNVSLDDLADVDISSGSEIPRWEGQPVTAVVWRGIEHSKLLRRGSKDRDRQLRPGDTIVLPVESQSWNVFGHIPNLDGHHADDLTQIDVGDQCQVEARRRVVLRLHPAVIKGWPRPEKAPVATEDSDAPSVAADSESQEPRIALQRLLSKPDLPENDELLAAIKACRPADDANWLSRAIDALSSRRMKRSQLNINSVETVRVRVAGLIEPLNDERLSLSETVSSEDDSISGEVKVKLQDHCDAVAELARRFADVLDLGDLSDLFAAVGRVHDLGKADQRFQSFLFGGNSLRRRFETDAYAKSSGLRPAGRDYRDAWQQSGLPDGFRHELLSLQIAEHVLPLELDTWQRDLYLHLIAAHHGHARPFAPVILESPDETTHSQLGIPGSHLVLPEDINAADRLGWTPPHRLDSGVSDRFWRLVRHFGWWGLAWLEAVFILADHRQSEREESVSESQQPASELEAAEATA